MVPVAAGDVVAAFLGDGFENCGFTRSIFTDEEGYIALELDSETFAETRDSERVSSEVHVRMGAAEFLLGNSDDAS